VTVRFAVEVVAMSADLVPEGDQAGTKLGLSRDQVEVLALATQAKALPELMTPSGRTNRTKFRAQIVAPLIDAGLLEMTVPGKPKSPNQRYRTTEAGKRMLAAE
jgi:ATP-dependent DNA helicase RecG